MATLFGLCAICGGDDLHGGEDGYYYCSACGSQSQQFQEQVLDFEAGYTRFANRAPVAAKQDAIAAAAAAATGHDDTTDPLAQSGNALFRDHVFPDDAKPWECFTPAAMRGSALFRQQQVIDPVENLESSGSTIRSTYLFSLQHILQFQCEALVRSFGVSPVVCGIAGPIWLRFVAWTRVMEKDWANEVAFVDGTRNMESKKKRKQAANMKKRKKNKKNKKNEGNACGGGDDDNEYSDDPDNNEKIGDSKIQTRVALPLVLLSALKERIPLFVPLAIVFLACHLAQESILPTDIVQWALNGSLPYLDAFQRLQTQDSGLHWPIEARVMLKPNNVIGARKLEFSAASIAKRIGLRLPPVNFKAMSTRFLKDLHLPDEKLSGYVCRFYDWYAPPGLWLSDNVQALPSRVYVMSMIIIVLKILYELDGRWYWDKPAHGSGKGRKTPRQSDGLPDASGKDNSPTGNERQSPDIDTKDGENDIWSAKELLEKLEESWREGNQQSPFEYESDLKPYLNYCQDLVFPGLTVDVDSESICKQLWEFYEQPPNKDGFGSPKEPQRLCTPEIQSLSGDSHFSFNDQSLHSETNPDTLNSAKSEAEDDTDSTDGDEMKLIENRRENQGFRSMQELVHDMEELGFSCLSPRKRPLPSGKFLRYLWRPENSRNVLHADNFILLSACAKAIRVQPLALHWCIHRIESSLRDIEKKAELCRI